MAREAAKNRRKAKKKELASLRTEKDREKTEQRAKDLEEGKVKYKTKRQDSLFSTLLSSHIARKILLFFLQLCRHL